MKLFKYYNKDCNEIYKEGYLISCGKSIGKIYSIYFLRFESPFIKYDTKHNYWWEKDEDGYFRRVFGITYTTLTKHQRLRFHKYWVYIGAKQPTLFGNI